MLTKLGRASKQDKKKAVEIYMVLAHSLPYRSYHVSCSMLVRLGKVELHEYVFMCF